MRKKALIPVVAAVMAVGLSACAGNAGSAGSAATSSAATESAASVEEEETAASTASASSEPTSSSAEEEAEPIESQSVEEEQEGESEEMTGMANPWTETTDIQEAIDATGIAFDPPVDVSVPEGMNFFCYRYTTDTIDALYESVDDELIIRVSSGLSGDELAGDYNVYSQNWEESLKGLTVSCRGDGETINVATFSSEPLHWAILCNAGYEGRGLTIDQISSLVNGMQAALSE